MSVQSINAQRIFERARDLAPPADREAFLNAACAAQPELRAQVEALLNAHSSKFGLGGGALIEDDATTGYDPIAERPGAVIGPYKLLEKIGEGGFGVVFMAEQDRPVRRRVAVKVIKPGMDTRQVIARFEAERQALALMDHPNIARVLDAGATDSGRPYFVMELVRGVPLTDFCDQNCLTIRERLELFATVCRAVQHAHHKGIIHRDLKPSNVLVTLHDGEPVAKVIDFGVAKATGQRLTEKTLFTAFAQMVGTPLYMSPEQAELSGLDVDTRSDIYSLGVMLYEVLTGATPFDRAKLQQAGYDEIRRIIREDEPPRPSTRLSTPGAAATTISSQRKSDPRRLKQLVRGELDWIVMKCLDKDRNRRYETANGLARDIERYLNDEPVQACPPTAAYRLHKFIRRNKGAVFAGGLVAAALVVGLIGTGVGLSRAAHERDVANRHLYRSLLGQAHSTRLARLEGYRPQVFSLLEQARRVNTPERNLADIRQEAVSCLGDFVGLDPVVVGDLPAEITAIALQPHADHLMVGMVDGVVLVKEISTGAKLAELSGHTARIVALEFDQDGARLTSADNSGAVRTWTPKGDSRQPADWQCIATLELKSSLTEATILPERRRLAALTGFQAVVFDLDSGKAISRSLAPPMVDRAIELDPQAERLATVLPTGVAIRDAADGQTLHVEPFQLGPAYDATFSADSSLLAYGCDEGLVVLEIPSFRKRTFMRADAQQQIEFHPREQLLAASSISGRVRLWNMATNREVAVLRGPGGGETNVLAFRRDGGALAAADNRSVRIWRLDGADERLVLAGHSGGVPTAAFSSDGRRLATGSKDRTAKIWSCKNGELLQSLGPLSGYVQTVAFHPDNQLLATGDYGGTVKLWDWQAGEVVAEPAHQMGNYIFNIGFSLDGRYFAASAAGLSIWDMQPIDAPAENKDPDDRASWEPVVYLPGYRSLDLCFSSDSKILAWIDRYDHIRVWDLEARSEITYHGPRALRGWHSLAFLPDSPCLAYIAKSGIVQGWNVTAGQSAFTLGDPGEFKGWHLSLSPDGRWLLAETTATAPGLWDLRRRKPMFGLPAQHSPIWALDWSPNSELMAIGLSDGGVNIWNLPRIRAQVSSLGLDWDDAPDEGGKVDRVLQKKQAGRGGGPPIDSLIPNARGLQTANR